MRRRWQQLKNRWKSLSGLGAKRDELDAEMEHHLELLAEEYERAGLSPEKARRAARARFGGVEHLKEECQESWGVLWLEALSRDVSFALRQMMKLPAFTATVVFTLALGIGACVTIFSVMQATVLKPLPVVDQDSLVMLRETNRELDIESFSVSVPNFTDFRDRSQSVDGLFAARVFSATLMDGGAPVRLEGKEITAGHMKTLGWKPVRGREFLPEEDRPGANRVAMISESLWRSRYVKDPDIVGRSININDEPHEVVGIFSDDTLLFGRDVHLWRPMAASAAAEDRGDHRLTVVGRLKPGVSLEQAQADMETIAAVLAKTYQESNQGWSVRLVPIYDQLIEPSVRRGMVILLAAVGMLLLIACANVANLLLSRAVAREREISMRMALGASRLRIARQLLSECALYCSLGTVAGLVMSIWGVALVRRFAPQGLPRAESIAVDFRAIAFAAVACAAAVILSGLIPALRGTRTGAVAALGSATRIVGGAPSKGRLRSALVVVQLALSLCLVAGAGLLIKSFQRLQDVDPGYDATGVFTFRISPDRSVYGHEADRTALYRKLIEGIDELPGIASVGMTSAIPLGPGSTALNVFSVDPSAIDPDKSIQAAWRIISPRYLDTIGVPLVAGRLFNRFDTSEGEPVVILSRELARQFWPEESALGKRVNPGGGDNYYTVVGVVEDARLTNLKGEPDFTMYFSAWQWWGWDTMAFAARSDLPFGTLGPAVRRLVKEIDPAQPIFALGAMEQYVDAQIQAPRLNSWLLSIFAGIALLLASVGVYGVVASSVSQRSNEIGVRMALGARRSQITAMVLRQGLLLLGLGLGLGGIASWQFSALARSQLFQVEAADPVAHVVAALILAGAAVVATVLPALRATRIEPARALRME